MHGANSWLMGLSFLLGLLLTFAFTIRRGNEEVPVSAAKPAGGTLPSEAETTEMAVGEAPYGDGSARGKKGKKGKTKKKKKKK